MKKQKWKSSKNFTDSTSTSPITTKEQSNTKQSKNLWNVEGEELITILEEKLNIKYDKWQKDYILAKGDTAARIGRQSGKSTGQADKTAVFCARYKPIKEGLHVLITGGVERQAYELFQKFKRTMEKIAPNMIKGRPTMEKMELTSGLIIRALPCGRDGAGLRNYACVKLVVDEAHFVHDDVYTAIEPMLVTTGGHMDLLSTTRGDKGRFRRAFDTESGFTTFHKKTKDVFLEREICKSWTVEQREFALKFIEKKQKEMTKITFSQEWEAEFMSGLQQIFTADLIYSRAKHKGQLKKEFNNKFLGVDLAGYGGDENAFIQIGEKEKYITVLEGKTTERVSAWETIQDMVQMEKTNNYKKIGIDSGGLGSPILDFCMREPALKRKIEGLNNSSKEVTYHSDKNKRKKQTILKEDMIGNLKVLFEQGMIEIDLEDTGLIESLLSMQFEVDQSTLRVKIFGTDSHKTEALMRACWCAKTKGLNIYIY